MSDNHVPPVNIGDENMTFGEALKILNIEDYSQRIFESNSHGELFHLSYYIDIARHLKDKDPSWFRDWFEGIVSYAESKWKRPESVFQHIDKAFDQLMNPEKA